MLSGALAGSWLTVLVLGNQIDADTDNIIRDSLWPIMLAVIVARSLLARRDQRIPNA